jgi:hypothetical protein
VAKLSPAIETFRHMSIPFRFGPAAGAMCRVRPWRRHFNSVRNSRGFTSSAKHRHEGVFDAWSFKRL